MSVEQKLAFLEKLPGVDTLMPGEKEVASRLLDGQTVDEIAKVTAYASIDKEGLKY